MIYTVIIIVFLLFGVYWYLQKYILLPSNTNQLIAEVKKEGVPELMPGKVYTIQNGDVSICYEIIGNSTEKGTIFLLNGLGQTMLGYPPHFYEPFLKAGYQLIRMDNRGAGGSSWVKDWSKENAFKLADMAGDVIAVLDNLHIKKVHFVGFSMGGMIAQQIAITYPQRVLSLVSMMSTGFYNDPELTGLTKKFYRDLVLKTIIYGRDLSTLDQKLKLHLAINHLLKGKGDYKFDNKEVLQKAFYENTQRNGYNKKIEPMHSRAIWLSGSRYDELRKLSCPTLVIHGKDDTLVLFEHGQKYAPMIPNAQTLFIEGLGHHFPSAHTPSMTRTILEFWENIPQKTNKSTINYE